jgi:hypothetical protein
MFQYRGNILNCQLYATRQWTVLPTVSNRPVKITANCEQKSNEQYCQLCATEQWTIDYCYYQFVSFDHYVISLLSTCYTLSSLLHCCYWIVASAPGRWQYCLTACCTVLTEHDGKDRNKQYTNTTSVTVLVKEREGRHNRDRRTQQNNI